MRFTKVEKTDEICRMPKRELKSELTEFMQMNIKCAKVTYGENEYTNPQSAYASLFKAAKWHAFPIKVIKRKNNVYLIRTDM